ncbi:3'-5' exonuclease [Pelagibaculum spongiae]|uniref:DNA-directed DNA polymerase n=1 Tax=Pelagibaculum spongiae TaxID=2080658 RepID=A0A2V1GWB2_9GAMM|nr:3'-5' exonuclease [Pelagibaculum spongiae]PVZ69614.1 DNA polymerase III subunit epsilon [Pelagibaculum spongiae]
MSQRNADTVVVLDFETSGLSPDMGDRAIEIGAVLIESGQITDRFQQLINPGFRISGFIADYTGITNAMLQKAEKAQHVMPQFAEFIAGHNLVAHNASFDQRFLDAELARTRASYSGSFACSMLLARRLYQQAPNHKLGTLVEYKQLPTDGTYHRALADAEMTAYLWLQMLQDIQGQYPIEQIPFSLLQKLAKKPKGQVSSVLQKFAKAS